MRSLAVVIIIMPVAEKSMSARYSGDLELLAPQVADATSSDERGGGEHDDAEEHAEPVDAHHARHRDDRAVVAARRCHCQNSMAPAVMTPTAAMT